jgi:hypothetical protein
VELRGEALGTLTIERKIELRKEAARCFDDDPNLKTHFEPIIADLRKELNDWYKTTLPMKKDPFMSAAASAGAKSAPGSVSTNRKR